MKSSNEIPNDVASEIALLGSALVSPKVIPTVYRMLSPDDFYNPANRAIYKCCIDMFLKKQPTDLVSIQARLKEVGILDKVGGPNYLMQLTDSMGSSVSAKHYADLIKDKSARRKIIQLAHDINDKAYKPSEGQIANDIREMVVNGLPASKSNSRSLLESMQDVRDRHASSAKLLESGKTTIGWRTFPTLDRFIDGICPGRLYLLTGYTSTGKSHMALTKFHKLLQQSARVRVVSLEMSEEQILFRLIAQRARLPIRDCIWRYNKTKGIPLTDEQNKALDEAIAFFSRDDIYIDREPEWSDMYASLLQHEVLQDTDVIIIDYAQNIRDRAEKNEYVRISDIVTKLQEFAVRSNIAIILISQVSQGSQKDPNREVLDGKGSGQLGASADVFMTLRNVDNADERDERKKNGQPLRVLLDVQKNRHGPTGGVEMLLYPEQGRYIEGKHSEHGGVPDGYSDITSNDTKEEPDF